MNRKTSSTKQSSALPNALPDGQNDSKTGYDECSSDESNDHDAASTCWELASYNVVLALEVAVEADEQHDDTDANKRCSQRLADMSQVFSRCVVVARYASVESEKLGYRYADAGEGERGTQPRKKGSLCPKH
jgi:hypothetical protein